MLILTGILRQSGELAKRDEPQTKFAKLWVEHETPRDNGPDDLEILEMILPLEKARNVPKRGAEISLLVRAYPKGKGIGYQALGIVSERKPVAA